MEEMEWPVWFGYAAVATSVVTCAMRTMVPLRILSMVCNSCFIIYGIFGAVYPTLFLNLLLLPLNAWRLREMLELTRKVEAAATGDRSFDWLKPYMSTCRYRTGDVLFRKGEIADALFYTVSGRFRLSESGIEIPPMQVVGELGLLAPDKKRTQTLECVEDGQILTTSYQQVKELYFQNPEFGFHLLELSSARLFQNIARLEDEIDRKNAALLAKTA
jgi:CRP/FNR family transcriptional regulator, cyclic AMP receptor protein